MDFDDICQGIFSGIIVKLLVSLFNTIWGRTLLFGLVCVLGGVYLERNTDFINFEFLGSEEDACVEKGCSSISLENECYEDIYVAMIYQLPKSKKWVTKGWWQVSSGDKLQTDVLTRYDSLYFHAYSRNNKWGDVKNDKRRYLVSKNFATKDELGVRFGKNRRIEGFFHENIGSKTEDYTKTFCKSSTFWDKF